MVKLTKAIIKKYGISKKAWAIARGKKSSLSRKKNKTVVTMARRKRTFGRKLFKSRRGKSKGNFFGTAIKILGGTVLAVAYEVFVSPLIPLSAMIKNIIELFIGLVLAIMPKMPMIVRGFGTALAVVNAYALVYPMIAGTAQGSADF